VDQAAEAVVRWISPMVGCRRWLLGLRRLEVERAMRSLRVVVLYVHARGKPKTPLPAAGSGKTNERILTAPQVPTVV
jgi:hypothetical protein